VKSSQDDIGVLHIEGVVFVCVSLYSDELVPIVYSEFLMGSEVFE
jgi:hypothetical protein